MGNMFPVKARASRSAKTKAMLAPPDPLNAPVKAEPEESRWENYMPGIAVVSSEPAFLHCFGASDKEDILCLAPASKGRRCRKKRVVGNYCKQHYQEWSALEKKKICDAVPKVFSKGCRVMEASSSRLSFLSLWTFKFSDEAIEIPNAFVDKPFTTVFLDL